MPFCTDPAQMFLIRWSTILPAKRHNLFVRNLQANEDLKKISFITGVTQIIKLRGPSRTKRTLSLPHCVHQQNSKCDKTMRFYRLLSCRGVCALRVDTRTMAHCKPRYGLCHLTDTTTTGFNVMFSCEMTDEKTYSTNCGQMRVSCCLWPVNTL